jgi:nucleoside-diphosphate-sugar epimerase
MKNKSALITGSTGFVGSNLVRRLVLDGWDTHILIRPSSSLSQLEDIKSQIKIHYHSGEINSLVCLMSEIRPTVVFHLASLFLANHNSEDVDRLISSNILFPAQLIEAMAKNDCLNLVNTGTSWQHYDSNEFNPVNLYSATKQAFEDLLTFFIQTKSIKCITLKIFDTYGPKDNRAKLISTLINIAASGEMLNMSPGEQQIDLVYIDDVVDAYILAAHRLMEGKVSSHEQYSVSTGAPICLRDLVNILSEVFVQPINVFWGARPYRPREVMIPWAGGVWLDGWHPKITLAKGLRSIKESIQHE